ncbi:MAG: MlaE family ABC transporter permease [Phycisphaerales bacterium]
MDDQSPPTRRGLLLGLLESLGAKANETFAQIGSVWFLLVDAVGWILRRFTQAKARLGLPAIASQVVRVGVRSVLIVSLVSGCVGLILVLQMAPPLDEFGRRDAVANIVGVAVLRELGPLIASIVLTGFAGAAIAAEIGTMVVGEEIEALEAHALNPVRFLVVPRVIATVVSMGALAVFSNLVAIAAGLGIAVLFLDISYQTYMDNLLTQVKPADFVTGIIKSLVFGLLIGAIACTNGLKVTGGAAGVGKATTDTVVQSVVAIIIFDLMFTALFYAWGFT